MLFEAERNTMYIENRIYLKFNKNTSTVDNKLW